LLLKRFLVLVLFLFGCKVEQKPFILDKNTYKMWKDFIKPTKKELAWAQIPWHSTFYDGLIESDRNQKPLLLWVMNGHPLGCT
tara:strand:- start:110 stop:358 length:249 start_codon:yes stop_codon:yes gene_type:complete